MFKFFLNRLWIIIPTFIGVTLVAFFLIRLVPGNPCLIMTGERGMSPERLIQCTKQLGFDKPLLMQYGHFMVGILHGDFGTSIYTKESVLKEFLTLFPATIELSTCAILFAIFLGVPAGIYAAVKRGTVFDHTLMGTALVGYSMPVFWWALILILFFSTAGILGWTPVSGRINPIYYFENPTNFMIYDALKSDLFGNGVNPPGAFKSAVLHLILPSIALGTIPLAVIARQTRSAMLEVLGNDYIRTAWAKGLTAFQVIGIHALRNALITVVTIIGLQTGVLLAGAILTETIFSWPGVGKWLVDSILRRDYPTVQGALVLIAMIMMFVNLAVDMLYGVINPKVRR